MSEMRATFQVPQALALACSQQNNSLILGLGQAEDPCAPFLSIL